MDKAQKSRQNLMEYANLALACLFSFAGGFFILPESGVLSTFMLIIPFAFACALLKLKWWIKLLFFAGFGYVLSAIYNYKAGAAVNIITGVVCGTLVTLAMVSVWLFKKKKPIYIAAAAVIVAAAAFHIAVMGSPVEAFRSDGVIKNYYSERYDSEAVALSATYYNREKGVFCADIYGKTDLTSVYTIYVFGGTVSDSYDKYVEFTLMEETRLAVTEALRSAFPDASFTVKQETISDYPNGKISPSDTTDYSGRMSIGIYIPSDITYTRFLSRAKLYALTVNDAAIGVEKLSFYGGKAGDYVRRINLYAAAIPQSCRRVPVTQNLTKEYICLKAIPLLESGE